MIGDTDNRRFYLRFILPFHLILSKGTIDIVGEIKKNVNPKLKDNAVINRCIKFTNYVINHSKSNQVFKKELDRMLVTDDFKKFFFHGGL